VNNQPKARNDGLVLEWVDDELVVYDLETKVAHCLSAEAASVRELCDGTRTTERIAFDLEIETPAVTRAIDELRACALLEDQLAPEPGYSRREAAVRVAKVGGAALAAPLIYSVAVPAAAAAVSCVANNAQMKAGGTCTATTAGTFGTANAAAGCCTTTGQNCYRGVDGIAYCSGGPGTCATNGNKCNSVACCGGGGVGTGHGACGTGNNCTN
jgi:hypothetical protein